MEPWPTTLHHFKCLQSLILIVLQPPIYNYTIDVSNCIKEINSDGQINIKLCQNTNYLKNVYELNIQILNGFILQNI